MAVYSDTDTRKLLDSGEVQIEGLVDGSIQPASVDFHLSDRPLKLWSEHHPHESGVIAPIFGGGGAPIVPWFDQSAEMVEQAPTIRYRDLPDACFILKPNQFALASTTERVKIGPTVAGRLEGKSSLARLGLIVHTTAGFFDPGFEGYPTLELLNVAPRAMLLRPNMPIAQMAFFAMTSPAGLPYNERGHYTDQGADPVASRYFENFQDRAYRPTHSCEHCGSFVAHTGEDPSDQEAWVHVTPEGTVVGRTCATHERTTAWPVGMAR